MRRVVLPRGPTGLGLNIVKTRQGPFVITAVVEGKAAALGGEIKVNDLLHAVDTTSLYDLDEAQTKALVAGTPSQLGTNVALWIQAAPNGSGTPIQAQVLAKLKNDKDALHAELANLKAEFKALQLLFVTSQAELDRLKGKDTGEAVLTETDEDEIQRLQQEAAEHLRAVKEHRKELRRLQHAARNPELNKPVSASDAASAATLSRKTQDLVQGLQHLHDDLAQGLQHLHDDALDEALVSELATDAKNLWLLRRQIAADPQAFFAQADTSQDGSLDRNEWAQACAGVLGHAAPDLANALFDMMDFDKSGHVSMGEFVEIRRAVRLFVMQAGFQELAVESLSGLVYGHLSKNAPAEEGTSLAEQTLDTLTELSLEEMRGDVAPLYAYLKEHGEQVKQDREARAKKLAAFEVEEAEGKFTQLPTAAYGDKDSFHKGLEVIGFAHPDVLTEMKREFLEKPDSKDPFTAWNSGPNETTCEKEWYFVADPFEDTHGWQDLSPEEWTPRFEYGGNRIPIRVQVFMHVMSAYPWNKKEKRFGDYKQAHKLDKSDPRWLHEKEVDKVKLVLCRYIKSQLDGTSLVNAFKQAGLKNAFTCAEEATPGNVAKAEVKAELIIQALSEGLHDGGDGSASTCTFEFLLEGVVQKDAATPEELEALMDHFQAKLASQPITEPEVIAGRGYTGPPYVKMNGSLRFASKRFPEAWTAHLKGNKYTNLVYACNSLLRKFSQISHIPKKRVVFRGMSGVTLPECFEVAKEGGGAGGVDFGFVSTTTDRKVAVAYLGGKAMPILFQFEVGDIDRGASLSFLSQYPNESEILIPPLSYLEVTGEPFLEPTEKGDVWVYPARINCNLKSQTIEEIDAHRQKEVLALVPYIRIAIDNDSLTVVSALAAELEETLKVRIGKGFHVLSAVDTGKKGVVEEDSSQEPFYRTPFDEPYQVRWSDGTLSDSLRATDIVMDKDSEKNKELIKEMRQTMICTGYRLQAAENPAIKAMVEEVDFLHDRGNTVYKIGIYDTGGVSESHWMPADAIGSTPNQDGMGLVMDEECVEENMRLVDAMQNPKKKLDQMRQEILSDFAALSVDLARPENISRLNQDSHYKDAMVKVIDFKHDRLSKLVKEFSCLVKEIGEPPLVERNMDGEPTDEGNYHKDPLATGLHIAVRDGRAKTLEALVAAGAPAGAVDRDGKTALWLACDRKELKTKSNWLLQQLDEVQFFSIENEDEKRAVFKVLRHLGLLPKEVQENFDAKDLEKIDAIELQAATAALQASTAAHSDKLGAISLLLACDDEHKATASKLMEATKLAGALDLQDNEDKQSALHKAIANGWTSTVAELLSLGANAALRDAKGKTGLMLAVEFHDDNEHKELVATLMEATKVAGALNMRDEDGLSALHMASQKGLTGTVKKLLSLGADAALRIDDSGSCMTGMTSLMLAFDNEHEAAAELMEATKLAGALDVQDQCMAFSALHLASQKGLVGMVVKLLSLGADATLGDTNGDTALILACENKHEAVAEELIQATKLAGAFDHQAHCGAQKSALHAASEAGLASTVAKLLSLGANATRPERWYGKTPIELTDNDEVKAAFTKHAEHSDITDDNKNMLLLLCARLGLASRLSELLQAGANAAHTDDKKGCTALMVACENKHESAAAELMGATKLADALDLQDDEYKRSALHKASQNGLAGTVAALLARGANAALADYFGRQPLDLARNDEVKTAFAEHAAKGGQAEQPSE